MPSFLLISAKEERGAGARRQLSGKVLVTQPGQPLVRAPEVMYIHTGHSSTTFYNSTAPLLSHQNYPKLMG